ncbi:response regulator transcription factor [Herbaspirillum sp. HC18]|nr:response regulator transcription factor [Herbaspirillum sp. HC18]
MGLRIDVIADTGWAAEGLAAALQRGAQAASSADMPDAIVARPVPLERWLAEASAPAGQPELIVALLPDAVRVLQRLPVDIPVLWLHPASHTAAAIDFASDRPVGRLPADASDAQLAAAVNALAHGLSVSMPFAGHPQPVVAPSASAQELAEPLTARELEVLELMAKGLANREIADALRISSHTAKFHVAQILDKTGSATRTEAVRQGLRLGLIGL